MRLPALCRVALLHVALAASAGAQAPASPAAPQSCATDSVYRALDFWVGEWVVTDASGAAGKSRIEKILDGCAIMEHWTDVAGWDGKSLFYVAPGGRRWKQVWVTPRARDVGGTKEKSMLAVLPDGSVRFQGELVGPLGRVILDRTTLTPRPDGTVRQLIEISRDGGGQWATSFDAIYKKR